MPLSKTQQVIVDCLNKPNSLLIGSSRIGYELRLNNMYVQIVGMGTMKSMLSNGIIINGEMKNTYVLTEKGKEHATK